jgi:hypothetical protein
MQYITPVNWPGFTYVLIIFLGNIKSASQLYKFYIGDLPWNAMLDWLSEDKQLYNLVLRSYRYVYFIQLNCNSHHQNLLYYLYKEWLRKWWVFNVKWVIFQHVVRTSYRHIGWDDDDDNDDDDDDVCYVLDQHA